MKVCVVGVGYVGLVTAGCLAEAGNNVVCVDNDGERIAGLKNGVIPIYEPVLAARLGCDDAENKTQIIEPILTKESETWFTY